MLRAANSPRKPKRRRKPARIVGLMADSATLGVHRNHLYLVLSGRRTSASLKARYAELKEAQAKL